MLFWFQILTPECRLTFNIYTFEYSFFFQCVQQFVHTFILRGLYKPPKIRVFNLLRLILLAKILKANNKKRLLQLNPQKLDYIQKDKNFCVSFLFHSLMFHHRSATNPIYAVFGLREQYLVVRE